MTIYYIVLSKPVIAGNNFFSENQLSRSWFFQGIKVGFGIALNISHLQKLSLPPVYFLKIEDNEAYYDL